MRFKFHGILGKTAALACSACISVFAQQSASFLTGESLFKENRTEEAVPHFKTAIVEGGNPKAYLYLSLAYYQLEMYKESLEVCSDGMKVNGTDKKVLAFNAGNTCFAMEDYKTAERWFSLAIAADKLYAPPVLNRANVELKQQKYAASLADYKLYLDLSPNDRQKPEIEQIINLLENYQKDEAARLAEEQRLKDEEARILAEQERLLREDRLREILSAAGGGGNGGGYGGGQGGYGSGSGGYGNDPRFDDAMRKLDEQRAELDRLINEQKAAQAAAAEDRARQDAEDAARRRKLLEDIAESLQNSETSNMNAGAEGTLEYGYETELE